jgi:hypothetical protein
MACAPSAAVDAISPEWSLRSSRFPAWSTRAVQGHAFLRLVAAPQVEAVELARRVAAGHRQVAVIADGPGAARRGARQDDLRNRERFITAIARRRIRNVLVLAS